MIATLAAGLIAFTFSTGPGKSALANAKALRRFETDLRKMEPLSRTRDSTITTFKDDTRTIPAKIAAGVAENKYWDDFLYRPLHIYPNGPPK